MRENSYNQLLYIEGAYRIIARAFEAKNLEHSEYHGERWPNERREVDGRGDWLDANVNKLHAMYLSSEVWLPSTRGGGRTSYCLAVSHLNSAFPIVFISFTSLYTPLQHACK